MGADRATNIKINIDIKSATAKLDQVSGKMRQMGTVGQQAGTKVSQGMNQATGAIKRTGDQSAASAVQFSTMANGMLNLSTSAVQTYTSISNLDRANNRAKASAVGLERAQDLLARKQLALAKIQEAGNGASRDAKLLMDEITTATNDLTVKTEKLKIEQDAVTDVYMLFAANIANVGVSSLMVYKTMTEGLTKAKVIDGLVTKKAIIVEKLHALAKWSSARSLVGYTAVGYSSVAMLHTQTFATKAATLATKALNFALGPVGLIIMGISAALVAYETNFMGFKDSINGFLGIQTDFNEGIDDGTDGINAQTEALNAQATAFDKLSVPMQNYITMQETMARQNNDPRELIRLAKFRGAQGFSAGVGSTQYTGNGGSTGAYNSLNTNLDIETARIQATGDALQERAATSGGFSTPSPYGNISDNKVEQKVQSRKPILESKHHMNPFGTIDQKVAFYEQSYSGQRDTLLSWIDNSWDSPGIQEAYIKKYWEVYDISGGFVDAKPSEAQSPVSNLDAILGKGYAGFLGAGGGNPNKSVFAAGFGGDGSIFNFKLDNRAMVQQALGVDIGAIAGTVNVTEAIRLGTLQKMGASFGGLGGRGQELINAFGGNATQAYQLARGPGISARARAENALADYMANSGLGNRVKAAGNVFGVTQKLGVGYRSNIPSPVHWESYGQVRASARSFGSDEIADREMAGALAQYQKEGEQHGMGNIHVVNRYYERTQQIAAASNARRAARSVSLGVDFNPNLNIGYWQKYYVGKGKLRYRWVKTSPGSEQQIREDIQVSAGISIPSAARMAAIADSFSANGQFSNFNNTAITQEAVATIGITEQAVFDIRFNSTRGDRELENRMRHIEQQAASSSGTSPL